MDRAAWVRGINVALAITDVLLMIAGWLTHPVVAVVAFVGLCFACGLASQAHEECRSQRHTQEALDRYDVY